MVAVLADALDVSRPTARVVASAEPCVIEGVDGLATLDALVARLGGAGFDVRVIPPSSGDGYASEASFGGGSGAGSRTDGDPEEEPRAEDLNEDGFRDFYRLLGVQPNASADEIKRAYRAQSFKYHPDRSRSSPRFSFYQKVQRALNEAYGTLSDPVERSRYDRDYRKAKARAADPASASRTDRAQEEYEVALGFLDLGELGVVEHLNRCLILDPEHADARHLLALAYVDLDDAANVRRVGREMVSRPESRYDGCVVLAEAYVLDPDGGDLLAALTRCDEAIALHPGRPAAYSAKARALGQAGLDVQAIRVLEDAPKSVMALPNLALIKAFFYAESGDYAVAAHEVAEVSKHLDPEATASARNTLRGIREGRQSRQAKVGLGIAERSTEKAPGCGSWAIAIVCTAIPPHFWGALYLIILYVSRESSKEPERVRAQNKGVLADAPIEPRARRTTYQACVRCDHCVWTQRRSSDEPKAACQQTHVPLELKPTHGGSGIRASNGTNPCKGVLFTNSRVPFTDGIPKIDVLEAYARRRSSSGGRAQAKQTNGRAAPGSGVRPASRRVAALLGQSLSAAKTSVRKGAGWWASLSTRRRSGVLAAAGAVLLLLFIVPHFRGQGAATTASSVSGFPLEDYEDEEAFYDEVYDTDYGMSLPDDFEVVGYSTGQGINWSLVDGSTRRVVVSVPEGDPLSLRDMPSARDGNRLDRVPNGAALTLTGCLPPRPEDGAQWCQTSFDGVKGWVYDLYAEREQPHHVAKRSEDRATEREARARGGVRRGYVDESVDEWLNLRPGPSTGGQALLRIPNGTAIDLWDCGSTTASGGRWCRTSYRGIYGWVYDLYVATSAGRPAGTIETERLAFDYMATDATVTGAVREGGALRYLVYVLEGQTVSARVRDVHGAFVEVYGPGRPLDRASRAPSDDGGYGGTSWRGVVSRSGDYQVVVRGRGGYTPYTLTVTAL